MSTIFSDNLRRLRSAKKYTQEQVATHLQVSPQSVSRWECGASFPDILLLPSIAELYCVTVDDLFREKSAAYKNYAARLLAVFESTLARDDFVRADNEYRRLTDSGSCTTQDLYFYGVLHEIAMIQCMDKALMMYNEVLSRGLAENHQIYRRAQMQRLHLLSHSGHNTLNLEQQRKELDENPQDPWSHILMLGALYHAKQYEEALRQLSDSLRLHADVPELYVYGGNSCLELGRYQEALQYFDSALALDPDFYDAKHARARCYEAMGNYSAASAAWLGMAADLNTQGFTIEAEEPRKRAEACRAKIE